MMDSLLLRTASRIIVPAQLIFSLILLVRGHNEPGGGFAGGLLAACAIVLHGVANGMPAARRLLHVSPQLLLGAGLITATASGLLALVFGQPFLTGLWGGSLPTVIAGTLKFGTPLLFDIGIYLTVAGATVLMVFSVAREVD